MLKIFPGQDDITTAEAGMIASDALWIDLLNPASAEAAIVEKTVGAPLPSLDALNEIETSSRLRNHNGILYMSTPSAVRHPDGAQATPPLRFVLSADRLVTVRFMPLPAFDAVAGKFAPGLDAPKSGPDVFALLCEEIFDRVADLLEHLCAGLSSFATENRRTALLAPPIQPAQTSCWYRRENSHQQTRPVRGQPIEAPQLAKPASQPDNVGLTTRA